MLTKEDILQWKQQQEELENLQEELKQPKQELLFRIDQLKEEYQKNNKDLIEKIEKTTKLQDKLKEDIKLFAVSTYVNTENCPKKLIGGIGIRVGVKLSYDEELALKWAKEHSLALSLDKKRFEQLAKTENIDFVKKEDKITATWPKELKLDD